MKSRNDSLSRLKEDGLIWGRFQINKPFAHVNKLPTFIFVDRLPISLYRTCQTYYQVQIVVLSAQIPLRKLVTVNIIIDALRDTRMKVERSREVAFQATFIFRSGKKD